MTFDLDRIRPTSAFADARQSGRALCRGCQAPVVHARTTDGRDVVLDAENTAAGTVASVHDDGRLVAVAVTADVLGRAPVIVEHQPDTTSGHRAHWATCPELHDGAA